MGLNDIQLPAQTVVDLYKNLLCEDDSAQSSVKPKEIEPVKLTNQEPINSEKATAQISFLGKNLMQLVILVDYDNEVYLPENQLNFIGNILKACKMNLADVAIVNVNKQQINIGEISRQLNPQYLIIFGVDTNRINFSQPLTSFNIITDDGMQVFSAPSLEQLNQEGEEGKLLKSKLWLCMKKMLNL